LQKRHFLQSLVDNSFDNYWTDCELRVSFDFHTLIQAPIALLQTDLSKAILSVINEWGEVFSYPQTVGGNGKDLR
jgi:hypothetical protein